MSSSRESGASLSPYETSTLDDFSRKRFPVIERFRHKIAYVGDCWEWTAAKTSDGYADFRVDGKLELAHRWSYEWHIGPIPTGMHIDHLCRNRACVNPAHMEPVTQRENTLRGVGVTAVNAVKTHCVKGHEFTEANIYYRPDRHGRMCRACRREGSMKEAARRKAARAGLKRAA